MSARRILEHAASLGVVVYLEEGKLKYKAKKGELPASLKVELAQHKREIMQVLATGNRSYASPLPEISPCDRTQDIPLSYAQLRLWFMDKIGEGSLEYNSSGVFSLAGGPLNEAAFKQALNSFIERHEALRTCFREVDGEPSQIISDAIDLPLSIHDFSQLADVDAFSGTQALAHEEAQTPFQLDGGLMIRVKAIKQPQGCTTVLYTLHHIASDGWSQAILQNELLQLYVAYCEGKPNPLPSLPIQYADYSVWKRGWLNGERLEQELGYWRKQLAGVPATHNLPLDKTRPTRQVFEGESICQTLGASLSSNIRAACGQRGVTLFMLLQTAFALLVSKYSNERDIVIGSPISGRTHTALEGLVGFFVNSLVLRTSVDPQQTFAHLLEQNKKMILDAYQHQNLPFEMLVEEMRPDRNLGYNSLFQIAFVVESFSGRLSTHEVDAEAGGGEGLSSASNRSIHFDLELYVYDGNDSLTLRWIYNKKIFTEQSTASMAGNFSALVAGAVDCLLSHRDTAIGKLKWVSDGQLETIATYSQPTPGTDVNVDYVHTLFEQQVEKAPEALALVYNNTKVSYQTLNQRANQLSRYLSASGVSPDKPVALCVRRSIEMIVAVLAILKAGGCYVPLDPSLPKERLALMIKDSGTTVLLTTQDACANVIFDGVKHVYLDEERTRQQIGCYPDANIGSTSIGLSDRNLAYVLYTSGSTGVPKGVMVTHRNVVNYLMDANLHLHDGLFGSVMSSALSFDATVGSLFSPLCMGKAIELAIEDGRLIERLTEYINHPNAKFLFKLAPAHIQGLLANGKLISSHAKHVFIIGGERLPQSLLKKWCAILPDSVIVNEYGPTETTVGCSTFTLHSAAEMHQDLIDVSIGTPTMNTQLYVLSDDMQPVPVGVTGEIYIAGEGVSRGYHRHPALTAERFLPNPFSEGASSRLYKTGDLVRWLPDGNLDFVNRIDNQVKIRGFRVELGEIEAHLRDNPVLSNALVVVDPRDSKERSLIAYVCPTEQFLEDKARAYNDKNIAQWSTVFDGQYTDFSEAEDVERNFVGWTSSYTGKPIEQSQMQEWLDGTMRRIASLSPKNILEIGCGSGLLLYRYADYCQTAHALDISAVALRGIQNRIEQLQWKHIVLEQGDALTTGHLAGRNFDTVIINSVAQYFPNKLYLDQVIEGLLPCICDGGKVLFGDVRSLDLFTASAAAIEKSRINKSTPINTFKSRVQRRIRLEKELLISPSYFVELKNRFPQIGRVDIHVKRGVGDNEMLRYRYDVVLHKSQQTQQACTKQPEWFEFSDLLQLEHILDTCTADCFGVSGVHNPRIAADVELANGLSYWQDTRSIFPDAKVGELERQAYVAIEALESLLKTAEAKGLYCGITWSQRQPDKLDLIFSRAPDFPVQARHSYAQSYVANYPQIESISTTLAPELSAYLGQFLPHYMVPSVYLALERLPLTVRGKIDRPALPLPEESDLQKEDYAAPTSEIERSLCRIWQDILKLEQIGINDNFFALGGHSLLATRLISEIRQEFEVEISLRALFEHATIAALAHQLTREMLTLSPDGMADVDEDFEEVLG